MAHRAVLDHDLMEHEAMSAACGQQLRSAARAEAPSLVDLGCGDLALLAPLLGSCRWRTTPPRSLRRGAAPGAGGPGGALSQLDRR